MGKRCKPTPQGEPEREAYWLKPQYLNSMENSVLRLHDHRSHFLMWEVGPILQTRNRGGSRDPPTISGGSLVARDSEPNSTVPSFLAWSTVPQKSECFQANIQEKLLPKNKNTVGITKGFGIRRKDKSLN